MALMALLHSLQIIISIPKHLQEYWKYFFPFAEGYNKFVPVTRDLLRLTITILLNYE